MHANCCCRKLGRKRKTLKLLRSVVRRCFGCWRTCITNACSTASIGLTRGRAVQLRERWNMLCHEYLLCFSVNPKACHVCHDLGVILSFMRKNSRHKLYYILYRTHWCFLTWNWRSVLVMIRYIENIDISFSISIYRIVSYCQKNIQFFWHIVVSFICYDIFDISQYFTPQVYIFITALPK